MKALIFIAAAIFTADARVTFPFSEVLQRGDLSPEGANFNCPDGCKVYTDQSTDALQITQDGDIIANFTVIVGSDPSRPDGLVLEAANNYQIQYNDDNFPDFVFYAVSVKAPNYGVPVFALQPGEEVVAEIESKYRFATLLSSFDALSLYDFNGDFSGLFSPLSVYATGYDTLYDSSHTNCKTVFDSWSQYLTGRSALTLFGPIYTVDFYAESEAGVVSVTANATDANTWPKSEVSSVVYTSPGFVGCPFVVDHQYESKVKSVEDSFIMPTPSLDISASYYYLPSNEAVQLRVNQEILDFYNIADITTMNKRYESGAYNVTLSWKKQQTSAASWKLQLDFGRAYVLPTTTTEEATTVEVVTTISPSTTPLTKPTTTSGAALSLFIAVATALVFVIS